MRRTAVAVIVSLLVVASGFAGVAGGAVDGSVDAMSAGGAGDHCEFPVTANDATGVDVTVDEEPEEVVVLAPSAAQTVWEIGAEETVTGMPVNQYTADLDGYDEREHVVNEDGTVNQEVVVDLEPDLVLAPNIVSDETVEQLRDSGLTVYKFDAATAIEDVYDKTALTGQLVGECDGADETVAWMEERVTAVEAAVEGEDRPSVYIPMGGGFTAGSGTFVSDVVVTAGGENIAETAGIDFYAEMSEETILEEDPEWIVVDDGIVLSQQPESDTLNQTTAIEEDQVVVVNANNFSQPAPRVVYALEEIAAALHSDEYEAPAADEEAGDAEEQAPGLGLASAIAALVTVSMLARRR